MGVNITALSQGPSPLKEKEGEMLSGVWNTYKRLKWLLIAIGILYVLSVVAGMATSRFVPEALLSYLENLEAHSAEQVDKLFGRFVQPLREGHLRTIAICSGIVFVINLLGDFANFTLPGILLVPIILTLVFGGWVQGTDLIGIRASSSLSLFLFLLMGSLEWGTYVIATTAGANIGLSFMFPKRQAASSRWSAFKSAWADAGRLYVIIAVILAIQAVFEVLYVRKVLLMGGSGKAPLMPY
jgi:hypothetical protein